MVAWVTAVQLLLVVSSTAALENKESFEAYFQNFFQRHQDKFPRAIPNNGPQNAVRTPKALSIQQLPVKKQPSRVVTPSLQNYNYQVPVPVPQYSYINVPQPIQYQKLQPPPLKYTTAYIPQYLPQVSVRSPGPDTTLNYRPEVNPSYQPSNEQPSRQYSFSPNPQVSKEQPSSQYSVTPSKEQPSRASPSKEQPSRQYSYTVGQPVKEEQRQFEKYAVKEYSSKKPSDEYYYKGSDQGYHEHVKVKSSHTHKKQTTGGTEDYFDGDYGDYDSKRGYRSLDGI